jgi:multiple antibiotic resistance protein
VISVALLLFLIMDPFGNLVVVNTLLSELSPRQRVAVILREGAIATGILLLAALFGEAVLAMLGLEEYALRLAGGIVLFLIALGMLFPARKMLDEPATESPLVVPIAMPLIAGPSAISMAILFAEEYSVARVAGAIVFAAVATTLLLSLSAQIFSLLGRRGAMAMERLMGMLLIMLSVQMVLDGINAFISSARVL